MTHAGQEALLEVATRRARTKEPPGPAPELPVAQVMVDSPLPHLDRPFDYRVTADQHEVVTAGVRVRVRFAGTDVAGIVLGRVEASDHPGRLTPLTRVVSPLPVLTDDTAALVRAVADRYAGTFTDVLRAAVPPRHARVEGEVLASEPTSVLPSATPDPTGWARYSGGAALLSRVGAAGSGPRAVWTALPGEEVGARIAELCAAATAAGRGALVVVPDARDVERVGSAMEALLGADAVVRLTADLGPAPRYRAFVRLLTRRARVAVGTRAAAFAPVADLGLAVLWDDGDDLHSDPHAPYWHAREVLAQRSTLSGCALVLGGYARSVEAAQALDTGWAREVAASRTAVRAAAPRVTGTDDDDLARDEAARSARLPHRAFAVARAALAAGPVLVQVPRRGYVPSLACQRCRAAARCPRCSGPLAAGGSAEVPACSWCGHLAGDFACPSCGGRALRAISVGAGRTAEELGRAFPSVPVLTSGRDAVLDRVPARPALVVCTPGAEPVAESGYAAALLLDGRVLLGRADLRATEEAVRRWVNAAALVRPASDGGQVVLVAESSLPAVQALVRWDPGGLAERERLERLELRLPPAWRVAELSGAEPDVRDLLERLDLPDGARVLGPVPAAARRGEEGPRVRALVSAPRSEGTELAAACKAASSVRSAARSGGPVTVRLDPVVLG